jgi:hypothetical protein
VTGRLAGKVAIVTGVSLVVDSGCVIICHH